MCFLGAGEFFFTFFYSFCCGFFGSPMYTTCILLGQPPWLPFSMVFLLLYIYILFVHQTQGQLCINPNTFVLDRVDWMGDLYISLTLIVWVVSMAGIC